MVRRKVRRDPEREKYWREVFKRFQKSGLPFKKFCAQEGISPNTFQFWRRELRERDEELGIVSKVSKGDNRPSKLPEQIEYWNRVIDEIDAHPGSQRDYCRSHGVSSGNLHHWRKRLKELNLPDKTSVNEPAAKPEFVPMHVVDFVTESVNRQIDITLNDGTRIAAPTDVSLDVLLKLVNGLRR